MKYNLRAETIALVALIATVLLVSTAGGGATYAVFTDDGSVNIDFEVGDIPEEKNETSVENGDEVEPEQDDTASPSEDDGDDAPSGDEKD